MPGRDFKTTPSVNGKSVLVTNTPQAYGAQYLDITQMAAQPVAPTGVVRRIFVDPSTGKLSVRRSSGLVVSLEEGVGSGVGFIHAPDQNVDHQYCDPIHGSDLNLGTSEGDATLTLAKASDNIQGAGRIDIAGCRYDMDESSTDFPPNGNFFHQANCIIRGNGMRKAAVGGTEINWIGGDGSRATGTLNAAAVGVSSFTTKAGSDSILGADVSMFVRIKKGGWGGLDLLTWITIAASGAFSTLDPLRTAITGTAGSGDFEIIRPIPLWLLGDIYHTPAKSWGASGGLEDIMFNVDGDLSVLGGAGTTAVGIDSNGYLQTGSTRPDWRSAFALLMGVNMQNSGWLNRIKLGDKEDAGLPAGEEYFHDCSLMFYAYSNDPAGKGGGGMGMNYCRDLWIHGGEYQILSAFSTNPSILSGGSSPGRWGRACITIPDANGAVQNLQIPMWKVEMRDRPTSWVNPGMGGALPPNGNPEEVNGVPFFFDIHGQKINLTGDAWSFQQEAGSPAFTPAIPAIRYAPFIEPPGVRCSRVSGTRFPNAFDAVNLPNQYQVPLPSGKATNIDLGGRVVTAWAASGTPTAKIKGAIEVRDDGLYYRTSTAWRRLIGT